MARISTYSNDTTVNGHDRLIGTDGGMIGTDGQIIAGTGGATKNFTITDLALYIDQSGPGTGRTANTIPVENVGNTALVDSIITQSEAGDTINIAGTLTVDNNVMLGGNILDMNGDPIISPTGGISGENQLTYETSTSNGGGGVLDIAPFSVHVFTSARMANLPADPADGTWVKIVQLQSTGRNILANVNRIMNIDPANGVLILDDTTASFELVWVADVVAPATEPVGWVIVGAN